MSFMNELYHGKIYPEEDIVPHDPTYRKMSAQISEGFVELENRLSPEDFQIASKIKDLYYQIITLENEASFSYGVKLGLALMTDLFVTDSIMFQRRSR